MNWLGALSSQSYSDSSQVDRAFYARSLLNASVSLFRDHHNNFVTDSLDNIPEPVS